MLHCFRLMFVQINQYTRICTHNWPAKYVQTCNWAKLSKNWLLSRSDLQCGKTGWRGSTQTALCVCVLSSRLSLLLIARYGQTGPPAICVASLFSWPVPTVCLFNEIVTASLSQKCLISWFILSGRLLASSLPEYLRVLVCYLKNLWLFFAPVLNLSCLLYDELASKSSWGAVWLYLVARCTSALLVCTRAYKCSL